MLSPRFGTAFTRPLLSQGMVALSKSAPGAGCAPARRRRPATPPGRSALPP